MGRGVKGKYKAENFKGEAKELKTLEDSAPMAGVAPNISENEIVPQGARPNPGAIQDATRFTERPFESQDTLYQESMMTGMDPDMILMGMYRILPSKEIAALMRHNR
ncbi:MAG: hypothetical protein CL508_05175 [Actinobacteria bacterium]|nr:hypothetical protein [Actinomycetota bacterium]